MLKSTVRKQIVSLLAVVEIAILQRFCNTRRLTESNPDTEVMSVIETVISWSIANAFQNSARYTAEERVVQICSQSSYFGHSRKSYREAIICPAPQPRFVKQKVEKVSSEKAKIEEHLVKFAETIDKK